MRLYKSHFSKRSYQINLLLNADNKKVTEVVNDKKKDEVVYVKTYMFPTKKEAINKYSERIEHFYSWGYNTIKQEG
ncbi:MAG: hypothetical protein N4A50_06455 [Vallitalea sp.]|nr:hypothetical protein [Vallitalea sp.]